MGRPKEDEFWEHVDKTGGDWKCKFCGMKIPVATSISRIKAHLGGIQGRGIQLCKDVSSDVKKAAEKSKKERNKAEKSIEGRNKKRKTMPSSSINEVWRQNQDMSVEEIFRQIEDHNMEQPMGEGGISSLAQVANQTENNAGAGQSMQLVETRGDELLTAELTGEVFNWHVDRIIHWLMDENVLRIGIYGMGGVGKTALAKHINNVLLKTPNTFHHVYWVTVSTDSSIYKLQNAIAGIVDLDLSRVEDEHIRAARLSKALIKNKKSVLILDDVWSYVPLNKVGIPVGLNECKLVLTARSLEVCQKMSCQKNTKVNPLYDEEEAWELFLKELGHQTILSPEIEGIAKSIAGDCKGLPFAIEAIATKMRGVDDIREWRDACNKLEGAKMDVEIFDTLKLSYDNLNDSALQQCFLYCALYPEDHNIKREELIEYLIVEGIIEEMGSMKAEFDRGHSILNRLEKVCLLEGDEDDWGSICVKMHDLVRDMAIQIMKLDTPVMVQAGKQLTEMPDIEEWTEDLVRCSLMYNDIKEIPFGYSPRCPKLTTLFLGDNFLLKSISDSFFVELKGVKVLNLSNSGISELPSSISYLVNLSALLLCHCTSLSHLPSLAALRALKRLDLYGSGVVKVPRSIELLSNLRYLNLQETEITEFPPGILPKLSNLQFLNLGRGFTVKAEEVASLRRLKTLVCRFDVVGEFNAYNKRSVTWSNLSQYHLEVGGSDDPDDVVSRREKYVSFCGGDRYSSFEVKDILFLPKHVQVLQFHRCNVKTNGLCLQNATELKSLEITSCDGMEYLLSLSSSPCIFQSLEEIQIMYMEDLQFLFSREATSIPLSPPHATFSLLKKFHIFNCPSMKKLFPPNLLPNLQNLEYIRVGYCENMVELIGTQEEEEEEEEESHESSASIQFTLPKLKSFVLISLPKLKSICRGKMICNSLQYIRIDNCEQLKKIPLSLVLTDSGHPIRLPSLQKIEIYPRVRWESVELDHPNAKDLLSPLCNFFQN